MTTKTTTKGSWTRMAPSHLAANTSNPIRKIVDNIKMPAHSDKELIRLSLGDPTVFGNLNCPDVLTEAVVANVRSVKHNGYIHSAGTEAARAAIATAYGHPVTHPLTKDDIIIASGGSGALDIAITGLVNPGENILLPKPAFSLYQVICDAHKIETRYYDLVPERNWEADVTQMASLIDSKTRAILVNNPSNPCGSVYSKAHLNDILSVAEAHHVPIIADEIYGDMTFGDSVFYPMASLTTTVPVISCAGLAKLFAVPGWRVGWIAVHDRNNVLADIRDAYFKLSTLILGANSLVQSAIPTVLTPTKGSPEEKSLTAFKKSYYDVLEANAQFTLTTLAKIRGLKVVVPQGAMYVMVGIDTAILKDIADDFDFTQKLLSEESVLVLPGQCFGIDNYFRVVFSAPQAKLGEAYERIARFCARHSA
ncbi:tyrosine aminotransferase [Saprolegnia parasitica CBS 223.65]|uniref:Tyrosine aminotransferase n=1 Tax=Saprolegnia parasitica (strain CBS 223.65) TaxID=695850 RepID=A0A067CC96_SAPPC|nr:tyrosine aminotransferase [Saprolegnia parasitica CBS 223.65]KDO28113.1 tyrosine aminotransferase [Saprolegnia parasitica CBS 223.65]|eukprot:XP_012201166.1 tyrosine aminotransferase [Saprolegnia parasitica CBS 223.65]